MKRLLVSILMLCSTAHAADLVYYVDTGSAGDGDGTTAATSGANCAFASLFDAEAALEQDLTAGAGNTMTIHCNRTNGGGVDGTAVSIAGWTTSETCYLKIVQDDFPSDGIFDDTLYLLENSSGTNVVSIGEDYVFFENVQFSLILTSAVTRYLVQANGQGANNVLSFDSCIFNGSISAGNAGYALYLTADPDDQIEVRNCTFSGFINGASSGFGAISAGADRGYLKLYGCTIENSYGGVYAGDTDVVEMYNTAIFNCAADVDNVASFDVISHCASDDDLSSADAGWVDLNENASGEWTAAFTAYSSTPPDLSVKDASSPIYNTGGDLSGTLDDDIIGTARPQATTYDIGAYEFISGTPPATTNRHPPVIWFSDRSWQPYAPQWRNETALIYWCMGHPNTPLLSVLSDPSVEYQARQRFWQATTKYPVLRSL